MAIKIKTNPKGAIDFSSIELPVDSPWSVKIEGGFEKYYQKVVPKKNKTSVLPLDYDPNLEFGTHFDTITLDNIEEYVTSSTRGLRISKNIPKKPSGFKHIKDLKKLYFALIDSYPDLILCGGASLYLLGLVKRPIKDLDFVTSNEAMFKDISNSFGKFPIDNFGVPLIKLKEGNVSIDIWYKKEIPKIIKYDFYNTEIKIEHPIEGIKSKINYILQSDTYNGNLEGVLEKHLCDLYQIFGKMDYEKEKREVITTEG